jgi:hypothetical protein
MNKLCVSLLAVLFLSGCAAAAGSAAMTSHVAATTGRVTGKLVMVGGPLGPGGKQPADRPLRGTVTFTASGHRQVAVRVGRSGTFSAALAPGRYQVSGRSPDVIEDNGKTQREMPCSQPQAAVITAGRTSTVTVACVVP